jgi:hypothetical protein
VARMEQRTGTYGVLMRKPEGKRPRGRHRRSLVDNIKMVFQAKGGGGGLWIGLIWLRIGTGGGLW